MKEEKKEFEDYCLVWQECHTDENLAERFFVPIFTGKLSFFLSGDDLSSFELEGKVRLREEQLLKGIFYGLFEMENDPKPWHQSEDKKTYLYLLDVLGKGFGFDDPEKMILDGAASMRDKNGNNASRVVLHTGLKLLPFSSKIRSDLICDSWALISEHKSENQLLDEIIDLASETYLDSLLPDAKEVICYYGFCAMVLRGSSYEETEAYLNEFVYPNVKMGSLKVKIRDLLLNPDAYSAEDLKVT